MGSKGCDADGAVTFWWSHRTLAEEAAPPNATAADASVSCLQTIRNVVQQQVVGVAAELVTTLPLTPLSRGVTEDHPTESAGVLAILKLTELLPHQLAVLRKAMERTWREHAASAGEAADARGVPSSGPSSAAALAWHGHSKQPLDERFRHQLRLLQRQISTSFLQAVQQGLMAATESQIALTQDPVLKRKWMALPAVTLDALAVHMCDARTTGDWHNGLVSALRPSGPQDKEAALMAAQGEFLQGVSEYVYEGLGLCPVDYRHNFPLVCGLSQKIVASEAAALLARTRLILEVLDDGVGQALAYLQEAVGLVDGLWLGENKVATLETASAAITCAPQTRLALHAARLTSILDYRDARVTLGVLHAWLPMCRSVYTAAHRKITEGPGSSDQKPLADAYGRLRSRCCRLVPLFAAYPDTSLAVPELHELLTKVFFVPVDEETVTLSARTACLRQCHSVLQAAHRAAVPNVTRFSEVCLGVVTSRFATTAESCNPDAPLDETGTVVLSVGYSLLQQPLATMQIVLSGLVNTTVVGKQSSVDSLIVESGGGSDRRAKALSEEPRKSPHDVGLVFFPRIYRFFWMLERAASLAKGKVVQAVLSDTSTGSVSRGTSDSVTTLIEGLLGAALEDALHSEARPRDTQAQACVSVVLMFLAFLRSPPPVVPTDAFPIIRCAARQFLGTSQGGILRYVHHLVGEEGSRPGLLTFFLPPLRALGVDRTVMQVVQQPAAALTYPISADVAYLSELPVGYFMRHAENLASYAAADALCFLDEMILEEEDGMVETFRALVVEAGKVVLRRLGEVMGAEASPAGAVASLASSAGAIPTSQVALAVDIQTSLFVSIVHLVREVRDASTSRRRTWLSSVVDDLKNECVGAALALPNSFFSLDTSSEEGAHWVHWMWQTEYEQLEPTAVTAAAKALVQSCNRAYMKHISTSSLLQRRSAVERRHEVLTTGAAACLTCMKANLEADVGKLRPAASSFPAGSASPAGAEPIGDPLKDREKEDADENTPSVDTATHASSPLTREQKPLSPLPVSTSAAHKYLETVRRALLHRAMLSPADGAAAGAAFRQFLMAAGGLFPPAVLAEHVRRMITAVATALPRASKCEAVSLAMVMYYLGEIVVLPYKRGFLVKDTGSSDFDGVLPPSEREATNLMNSVLNAVTTVIRNLLSRSTFVGDLAAASVAQHSRQLIRLVARHAEVYQKALAHRSDSLARASMTSPGFQALLRVECPLPEGMKSPAMDVYHLFTSRPLPTAPRLATAPETGALVASATRQGGDCRVARLDRQDRDRDRFGDREWHRDKCQEDDRVRRREEVRDVERRKRERNRGDDMDREGRDRCRDSHRDEEIDVRSHRPYGYRRRRS